MSTMSMEIGTLTGVMLGADGVFRGVEKDGTIRALNAPELLIASMLKLTMDLALPAPGVDTSTPGYQLALHLAGETLHQAMLSYGQMLADKAFVQDVWQHAVHGQTVAYDAAGLGAIGLGIGYQITPERFVAEVKAEPDVLNGILALMDHGVTGAQIWAHVQHEAPGVAVELIGVPPHV